MNSGAMSCTNQKPPVLFLSHGGGPCWYMDGSKGSSGFMSEMDKNSKSANFMRSLQTAGGLPRNPKAILVISAHWEEVDHTVSTAAKTSLYFDYYGFPDHTYKLQWPVPGEPQIARRVCQLLQAAQIKCLEDNKRGLDHGVFVPLKLVYPEADVPVLQVSLKKNLDIVDHLKLGEALQPLRDEGVLIVGSGMTTHNMNRMGHGSTPDWCVEFTEWFHDALSNPAYSADERKRILMDCLQVPSLASAHPRIEHFIPSLVASAAAGYRSGTILYNQTVLGSMVMSSFRFD